MSKPAVIVTTNDLALQRHVHTLLRAQGCEVFEVLDAIDILRYAQRQRPDLMLLGPFGDGAWDMLHIAQQIRRADRLVPLILIVAHSSEALAFSEHAASVARRLSGTPSLPFSSHRDTPMTPRPMPGENPSMRQIKTYIGCLALTGSTVPVTGESSTGLDVPSARRHDHVTL